MGCSQNPFGAYYYQRPYDTSLARATIEYAIQDHKPGTPPLLCEPEIILICSMPFPARAHQYMQPERFYLSVAGEQRPHRYRPAHGGRPAD